MAIQMQQGTIENPIVLDYKDSRKKVRTLKISGFVKPSGRVVAKVTNDKGVEYFVDGDECRNCPSHGKCYHRQAVAQVAHLLPSFDELASEEVEVKGEAFTVVSTSADTCQVTSENGTYIVRGNDCLCGWSHCRHQDAAQAAYEGEEPTLSGYNVFAEACQVAANAEAQLDADMYNELASTKKVSVPASGGEDWDYCEGCQCRVKKGQRRCPNC